MPTPTTTQRGTDANLEIREGAGPNLHNAVALLPTPLSADGGSNRGSSAGYGLRNVSREIARGDHLLPTPMAADGERMSHVMPRGNPTLIGALTDQPSPAGSQPPDAGHPGQLSLGEQESA